MISWRCAARVAGAQGSAAAGSGLVDGLLRDPELARLANTGGAANDLRDGPGSPGIGFYGMGLHRLMGTVNTRRKATSRRFVVKQHP